MAEEVVFEGSVVEVGVQKGWRRKKERCHFHDSDSGQLSVAQEWYFGLRSLKSGFHLVMQELVLFTIDYPPVDEITEVWRNKLMLLKLLNYFVFNITLLSTFSTKSVSELQMFSLHYLTMYTVKKIKIK